MSSVNNIPSEYRPGFEFIFILDDGDFNAVTNGLKGIPLTSSIRKLSTAATKFDPDLQDMVAHIFLSVGSLTSVIEKGISIEQVANDICKVLSDEIKEELEEFKDADDKDDVVNEELKAILTEEGNKKFVERLSRLLNTERLYYAAKANDLMYEYQNVFIQARIMTDIRPIFSIKTEDLPIAGLVIHNLHIHYKGDRETEHRDLFLSLDSDDLKSLKDIITRAENKESSLATILKKSEMDFING